MIKNRIVKEKSSCNVETLTMERLNYVFFQTMMVLCLFPSFPFLFISLTKIAFLLGFLFLKIRLKELSTCHHLFLIHFSFVSLFDFFQDLSSREVSILWSYLDITLLFSSIVYLILFIFGIFFKKELISSSKD